MPLRLSIIIPFYNVERYIAECLDSVYQQDIPEEEYEVICVNDGSPDHSRDIVLEYQKQHPNLVLAEHEVNKKLGAARNTGRSFARGKYIWNVDSDDKIVPNCLGELLQVCEENDLDVLSFGFIMFSEESEKMVVREDIDRVVYDGEGFVKIYGVKRITELCPVWKQIYKRDYLDSNDIFSPPINMGEDIPYSLKSFLLAKRLIYYNVVCYRYRLRRDALTDKEKKHFSPEVLFEKSFISAKNVLEVTRDVPNIDIVIKSEVRTIAKYIAGLWDEYYGFMNGSEQRVFREICRKNKRVIMTVGNLFSRSMWFNFIKKIFFGC